MDEEQIDKTEADQGANQCAVVLTVYEWHLVLQNLERLASIANCPNRESVRWLYSRMTLQLHTREVELIVGQDKNGEAVKGS